MTRVISKAEVRNAWADGTPEQLPTGSELIREIHKAKERLDLPRHSLLLRVLNRDLNRRIVAIQRQLAREAA